MMKNTKLVFKSVMMTLLLNGTSIAGEVVMYGDKPPTADEMGGLLFPAPEEQQSKNINFRSRSIDFGGTAVSSRPVPEVAEEVTVGLPIEFAYNSDKILPKSKPYLDEVGKMLNFSNLSNKKLMIEGHTDAKGSKFYNVILSQKRADSVKRYLVENFQISNQRLMVSGKGESEPLKGKDPLSAQNRRVQLKGMQ